MAAKRRSPDGGLCASGVPRPATNGSRPCERYTARALAKHPILAVGRVFPAGFQPAGRFGGGQSAALWQPVGEGAAVGTPSSLRSRDSRARIQQGGRGGSATVSPLGRISAVFLGGNLHRPQADAAHLRDDLLFPHRPGQRRRTVGAPGKTEGAGRGQEKTLIVADLDTLALHSAAPHTLYHSARFIPGLSVVRTLLDLPLFLRGGSSRELVVGKTLRGPPQCAARCRSEP